MALSVMSGKNWEYILTEALKRLGGEGHLDEIERKVKQIAEEKDWSLPKTLKNSIQEQMQQLSSDSEKNAARGRPDLFEMLIKTEGWSAKGRYRLRNWTKKKNLKERKIEGGAGSQ